MAWINDPYWQARPAPNNRCRAHSNQRSLDRCIEVDMIKLSGQILSQIKETCIDRIILYLRLPAVRLYRLSPNHHSSQPLRFRPRRPMPIPTITSSSSPPPCATPSPAPVPTCDPTLPSSHSPPTAHASAVSCTNHRALNAFALHSARGYRRIAWVASRVLCPATA